MGFRTVLRPGTQLASCATSPIGVPVIRSQGMPVGAESFGNYSFPTGIKSLPFTAAGKTSAFSGFGFLEVFWGQFMPSFAVGQASVKVSLIIDRIVRVLTPCAPRQIFKTVVCWIVVGMAALLSFGTRPDKSLQNKSVDGVGLSIDNDVKVPFAPSESPCWRKNFPSSPGIAQFSRSGVGVGDSSIQGPNKSGVAGFIAFQSRYGCPPHGSHVSTKGDCL